MSRAVACVDTYGSSEPLRAEHPATRTAPTAASCCSSGESGVGSVEMRNGSRSSTQSTGTNGPSPRVPADDVETVEQLVAEVEAGLLDEHGPRHAGPSRVDEQGADAIVLVPGRAALHEEVDGALGGIVVVERDGEGAALQALATAVPGDGRLEHPEPCGRGGHGRGRQRGGRRARPRARGLRLEAGGRIDNSGRAGPAQDTAARPTTARTPVKPRRTRRCYGRVAEPQGAPSRLIQVDAWPRPDRGRADNAAPAGRQGGGWPGTRKPSVRP